MIENYDVFHVFSRKKLLPRATCWLPPGIRRPSVGELSRIYCIYASVMQFDYYLN